MNSTIQKPTKLFTVEEANQMLPLIRAIASDLVALSSEVMERRQRLDFLTEGRDLSAGDVYGDELAEVEKDLERDTKKLHEYVDELRELLPRGEGRAERVVVVEVVRSDTRERLQKRTRVSNETTCCPANDDLVRI